MPRWRYQADGGAYTVDENTLTALVSTGKLGHDVIVQEVGTDDWINISNSPFSIYIQSPEVSSPLKWYYETGGRRIGPLRSNDLITKHANCEITDTTLVWSEDFGSQWKCFSDAGLVTPAAGGPPPLPTSHLTDIYAWLFALVPLLGMAAENLIKANSAYTNIPTTALYFTYILSYIALGALDARAVENSGRMKRSVTMKGLVWIAPAYLFQRARALGQRQWLVGIWFVAFLGAIGVQNPEVLKGNIYLGFGIPPCSASASNRQVSQIFETIPMIKAAGLSAKSIENQQQISASDNTRKCSASVIASNGGTLIVIYDIIQHGEQYYYYVRMQN